MAAELKPCQFCGGQAYIRSGGGWYGAGCETTQHGVMCPGYCHARHMHHTEQGAVAARNRRSTLAAHTAREAEPSEYDEAASVIACARRVYSKFGADSDWSEWRDLDEALKEYDAAQSSQGEQPEGACGR